MAQVVECLISMREALSSSRSTANNNNNLKKKNLGGGGRGRNDPNIVCTYE
jgi:hypothetical protein